MEMTLTGLPAIPVEYIIGVAQTKATAAQRRPYVSLIEDWGKEQNMELEASDALKRLGKKPVKEVKDVLKYFNPRYREPEQVKQLIKIIREIDETISAKTEMWTWAHVMRVMVDEGILLKVKFNRFDEIVCALVPGKMRDNVRKNGDYNYLMGQEMPWSQWGSNFDYDLRNEKTICEMIASKFGPLLGYNIEMEY